MLFSFFLKRFILQFLAAFFIIVLILGASNLVLRTEFISGFFAILQIFFVMLPLMAIYATPLASGIAVQKVVGDLMGEDELLVIDFFSRAKKSLIYATLAFSILLSVFYVPLVFEYAPQSYLLGKRIILNLAKQQFLHLEPQKFHSPYPGITFYFKEKKYAQNGPRFCNLFLAFHSKNERYVFTAKEGFFEKNKIFMLDGSVHTISEDKRYAAIFNETTINLDKILNLEKSENTLNLLKFCNAKQLLTILGDNGDAAFELCKRLAQTLWLFLFPLIALCLICIFGRKKSNLLFAVVSSGILFFLSYIFIAAAQVVSHNILLAVLFLYVPIIVGGLFCLNFFRTE